MDLTYTQDKMFIRFFAESKDGESAWGEMASKMGGVATVLNFEAGNVIAQLRSAGYIVSKSKSKKVTNREIDELLELLEV